LVYEVPELYKALALAYERARLDEGWRVAHSRLNELTWRVERLLGRTSILGLKLEGYMKAYTIKLLRGVEDGDIATVIDVYMELDRVLKPLEARTSIAYVHLILGRLVSAVIVIGVGMLLTVNAMRLDLLLPSILSILSIGVSIGGLLLTLRSNAHLVILGAIALQLLYTLTYISYRPQDATLILTAVLISLMVASTLLVLHSIARGMVYSEVSKLPRTMLASPSPTTASP
jgi:hypothetical protein